MKDALQVALTDREEGSVDRILAASFFRTRPLQAGSSPVVDLADRRATRNKTNAQYPR